MKTAFKIGKKGLISAVAMGIILVQPQIGHAQSDASPAATSSSDHGPDLLDRMDAAESRLHDKASAWKKSNQDWKSKGSDWQEAQKKHLENARDRVKSKWSSDKEKLVGDAQRLKAKTAAMTDAQKARFKKESEAGRQRLKALRESHRRDNDRLKSFASKTKKDFKDLAR